jgi:hypothetical protein
VRENTEGWAGRAAVNLASAVGDGEWTVWGEISSGAEAFLAVGKDRRTTQRSYDEGIQMGRQ